MNETQRAAGSGPRPRWLWLLTAPPGSALEIAATAACRAAARAGWQTTVVLPWRSAASDEGQGFGAPGEIVERRAVEIALEHSAFRGELRREAERPDGLTCWWAMPQSAALAPPLHASFLSAAALDVARDERAAGIVLAGLGAGMLPILLNTRFGAHPQLENLRTYWVLDRFIDPGWIDSATLRELGLPRALADTPFGNGEALSVQRAALLLSDGVMIAPGRGVREAASAAAATLDPVLGEILQSRQESMLPFAWHIDRSLVPAPVSADDQAAKATAKLEALAILEPGGPPPDPRPPWVVVIEPSEAALELLTPVLPMVAKQRARLTVVAGPGDPQEKALLGADILIAAEPWEPFGLDVARAMRFGTLPVFFAGGASALAAGPHGFPWKTALSSSLQRALGAALSAYRSSSEWRKLRAAAMRFEDPWPATFKRWQGTWRDALARPVRRVELPSAQRAVADAPDHPMAEPSREVYIDWGPALPERYGEDAIALLVQSPRALLVYWDTRRVEESEAHREREFRLRLRDGDATRELATVGAWGDFWIAAEPGRTYRVELVEFGDAADLVGRVLLQSEPAATPPERPSASARVRWFGGGRESGSPAASGASFASAERSGSEGSSPRPATATRLAERAGANPIARTPSTGAMDTAGDPGTGTSSEPGWVPGLRSSAPPVRADQVTSADPAAPASSDRAPGGSSELQPRRPGGGADGAES